jgi:hypothetical protein
MASGLSRQSRMSSGAIDVLKERVFVDTEMIHPALIRASVDLLGAECVMAGSDWPIVDDGSIHDPLAAAMRIQICPLVNKGRFQLKTGLSFLAWRMRKFQSRLRRH